MVFLCQVEGIFLSWMSTCDEEESDDNKTQYGMVSSKDEFFVRSDVISKKMYKAFEPFRKNRQSSLADAKRSAFEEQAAREKDPGEFRPVLDKKSMKMLEGKQAEKNRAAMLIKQGQ